MIWQSGEMSLSDARKLELALKRQKGGNGFYQKIGKLDPFRPRPAMAGPPPQPIHLPRGLLCTRFAPSTPAEQRSRVAQW